MQNKILVVCCLGMVGLSLGAFASGKPYDPRTKPTNDEERQIRREWVAKRKYAHTGGMVMRKGSLKGEVAIVNCQSAAGKDVLERSISYLGKETRFAISLREGQFSFPNPKIEGNVSLFVVDDANLPGLLAAPENRWVVVNVAPLKKGRGENPVFFKARVLKEMSRGYALLCGAMSSGYPGSLTGGIFDPDGLDRISDERLSMDVVGRFAPYLQSLGVSPAEYTAYRQACKEGWADSPKDEVQKKIWDEIHAVPDKPLQIKFDPSKKK